MKSCILICLVFGLATVRCAPIAEDPTNNPAEPLEQKVEESVASSADERANINPEQHTDSPAETLEQRVEESVASSADERANIDPEQHTENVAETLEQNVEPSFASPVNERANIPVENREHNSNEDKSDVSLRAAIAENQKNVRAMFDNGQAAIQDVARTAAEEAMRMLDSSKDIFNNKERSSLTDVRSQLMKSLTNARNNVLTRAIQDFKPVAENARAFLAGSSDTVNQLRDFIAPQGENLIRSLLQNMDGSREH